MNYPHVRNDRVTMVEVCICLVGKPLAIISINLLQSTDWQIQETELSRKGFSFLFTQRNNDDKKVLPILVIVCEIGNENMLTTERHGSGSPIYTMVLNWTEPVYKSTYLRAYWKSMLFKNVRIKTVASSPVFSL